ncbi:MAG: hypothetical protein ABL895_21770 [Cyclobacteriaceae bacterium]
MRPRKTLLSYLILFACTLVIISCSGTTNSTPIVFVGSTPGDKLIKSQLTIPSDKEVDFIRWNLILSETTSNQNTFSLKIAFGVSQPNTLGFKMEEKLAFNGTYTIAPSKNKILDGVIYHLKSNSLPSEIMMVKLNENILHLLTPQHGLMIGNGGWSYTLNRKELIMDNAAVAPALTSASTLLSDTTRQVIYDGRTPCQDYATEHQLKVTSSCFKLKWRLILNRNPITHEPTTYTIRKVVDNVPRDVSGNWAIIKGIDENPDVIIYQLDPEYPENSICFLAGDENVLFFLDKNFRLHAGNGDFSYTLNKRP